MTTELATHQLPAPAATIETDVVLIEVGVLGTTITVAGFCWDPPLPQLAQGPEATGRSAKRRNC